MSPERLLAHFDRVADAPDAVPHLRRFVMDLAVRGKLVDQNLADEHASKLLKRIATEKERMVKRGEIKPQRMGKGHVPPPARFDLPTNWAWTDLQAVCISVTDGDHMPPPKAKKGVPFLVISNVRTQTINYQSERWVPHSYYEALDSNRRPRPGDILYTLVGSFGIPVEVLDDKKFCVQRHIGIIRPSKHISSSFLARVLNCKFIFEQAVSCATGIAQKTIPLSGLRSFLMPLPPLAEQHRVVAKVDELLTLCEQLEVSHSKREDPRDRLTKASYARLSVSDTDDVTFRSHAHLVVEALPKLTARADQVKRLRQTILDLATRGKLVEQDPANEPASELLNRIEEEKSQLNVRQHVKPFSANEIPYSLPLGWLWSRIGELCTKTGSGSTPRGGKSEYKKVGVPFLRSQNVHDDGLRLNDVAYIEPDVHARMAGTAVKPRDLLLNITGGSMGRCCRVPDEFGEANVSQHVAIIRLAVPEMADYLQKVVLSPYFQVLIFDEQTGAGRGGLPKYKMDCIAVAVPPLAEQIRIVSTVDKLMTRCDQLEACLDTVSTGRHRLLESLLRGALEPTVNKSEAATLF